MTLHEAIQKVLKEQKGSLSSNKIAEKINIRQYYTREDKKPVPASQVIARAYEYPTLFIINPDKTICLKENIYNELLALNTQIIDIISKSKFYADELLLSSLYFFKRVIDNIEKYDYLFESNNISTHCDIKSYISFLYILDKRNKFYGSLVPTAQKFDTSWQNREFEDVFHILNSFSLAEKFVPIEVFSSFFNTILTDNTSHKASGNFYPLILNEIIGALTEKLTFENIYIPYSGGCQIPTSLKQILNKEASFYGDETNITAYTKGLMNLLIHEINTSNFNYGNSFLLNSNNKFDLVVCYPPFGAKLPIELKEYRYNLQISSDDLIINIIQISFSRLNEFGKAIIILPESYLFSKNALKIRKYFIENNYLEAVISLPTGLFSPYSSIKTSILVFSKKNIHGSVDFIAIDNLIQFQNNKPVSFDNATFQIMLRNDLTDTREHKNKALSKCRVEIRQLQMQQYNLAANRYLNLNLNEEDNTELVLLKEICDIYRSTPSSNNENLPFVNIKDLNKNFFDFNLKFETVDLNAAKRVGKLITEDVLLISSIFGSLKPTYFFSQDGDIIISSNVYAFHIKKDKVVPEYLVYELSSKYVSEQLDSIAYGATTLRRINKEDFRRIRIKLPAISEQRKILKEKKDVIFAAKLNEVNSFASDLGISSKTEKELLGFVKHEIGNIIGGVTNNLENILFTLNKGKIDLQTKVSSRKNAPSIANSFEVIYRNLEDVNNLMSNIQSILDLKSLNTSKAHFKAYIRSEVEKMAAEMNDFNFFYGIEEDFNSPKDVEVSLDRQQFGVVIRNFLLNSMKHGYNNDQKEKNILFNLSFDKDFNYISLINDGDPFPEGFDVEKFKSFGGRFDNTKGSGLGGYLINKIIENHHGEITLLKEGKAVLLDSQNTESGFINPSFIKVGVHFLIKIPKNNTL